ncbi:MAG: RluA family pseudouridine synthase [Clostridiales bacterium]|nr:RluA family pseudouridine synthase [Clostridiales bacterium]
MKIEFKVENNLSGISIKQYLINNLNMSKRLIIKLKKNQNILCNKIPVYVNYIMKTNDIITINLEFNEENNIVPFDSNLNILYEDESFLIVDKPANLPTHPSAYHYDNTLSNIVRNYYMKNNIDTLIRPVNRLDKNTSGIVVFAKNQYVQEQLIEQMKQNIFKKEYICIINGHLKKESGIINLPIAREKESIIKRCISDDGDTAITEYTVIKRFYINDISMSLVKVNLLTGRTHQIRVHFSHIGYHLIGDSLYGTESDLIDRQALHCVKLSFIHPITKKELIINSDIPKDIQNILKAGN